MKRFLDIFTQTISILLYPLWMPTVGIVLFCCALHSLQIALPTAYWWVAIGSTFFITALIPLSLILVDIRRGAVKDLQISNHEERTMPYIYTAICYGFWVYFLVKTIHAPLFLSLAGVGATFAIAIVTLINRYWKISAHLTGLGGLIGGVLSYHLSYHIYPSITLIIVLLVIALILMYARLWLRAHTDWQVIAGFGLGLLLTTLPTLIVELC